MAYTTINKSSVYFNTLTYTGNDGTGRSITGVGFQPDFVWVKDRSNAFDHGLFDAVRGATKAINSNDTSTEDTISNSLTAFGSDGFTAGANAIINGNNNNYASWNWKANGSGSSNTAGSINSTVSANTTAGMSIVKYTGNGVTGATIGHGLGKIPTMMIVKNLSRVSEWTVYHKDIGNTHYLELNSNVAKQDYDIWHDTTPTANVFYARGHERVNYSGDSYIAYIFTDIQGYSKFGSYKGNGNADGSFIYTGFKPAFVMVKMTSEAQNWGIYDNKRLGYNEVKNVLFPNLANVENTDLAPIDLLSNGFKMRRDASASDQNNKNNATYIYMAFAEAPLVGTNNVPCTAR